jgi:hypothetical protein
MRARGHADRTTRLDALLVGAWLAAVLAGSALLWRYKSEPGARGDVPEHWPADVAVHLAPGVPTLILFAHPQCPCSRASIGELATLVAKAEGRVDAHVLFDKPSSEPADWTDTDLWRSAAAIPGVSVAVDPDGATAHRFGAETSGWVVLYEPGGRLLFRGGITSARGHAGDSEGRRAVLALLGGEATPRTQAPVFGCSLAAPELADETGRKEAAWTREP